MRLDPLVLQALEERARRTGVALSPAVSASSGTCPTCGQALPNGHAAPSAGTRGKPRYRYGEIQDRVREYLARDTEPGNQTRCAQVLGCRVGYVNRIKRADEGKVPRVSSEQQRERVKAWMGENPYGSQQQCADALGFTRQYVSKLMGKLKSTRPPRGSDER
jgi:hypothetical protein